MKRHFSKRVAPVLLAISMAVNSTGVNVLAATGTASDPVLREESSEANGTASEKAYEKVSEEENEKIFGTASPSDAMESPSDATRISSDIMPISEDTTMRVETYMQFREALMDSLKKNIDTVILDADITMTDNTSIAKNVTIDLNNHKIIEERGNSGRCLHIYGEGEVTLKNGTISETALQESVGLVVVDGGKLKTENMKFETNSVDAIVFRQVGSGSGDAEATLSADSSIETQNGAGIAAYGSYNYTINVAGKISVHGDQPAIISKAGTANTDINIQEGAEITGGIVQMSSGNVVIEDGAEIESGQEGSAVSITNGFLTVRDGATIKATSPFEAYEPSTDGDLHDGGSAIFAEPAGNVTVMINGGTITSTNGAALYAPKEGNQGLTLELEGGTLTGNDGSGKGAVNVNSLEKFISGGTYNTDIGQYVVDNKLEVKATHFRSTLFYVGNDAISKVAGLTAGDTVDFQKLGEEKRFAVALGVIVWNHTGENITINGITLPTNQCMTVTDEYALCSISVEPEVTNHLEDFDETLANDYGWTSYLGYAEPGADITYTITISNEKYYAPTENLFVQAEIPAGTTLVSASGTYQEEDGCVVWRDASVGSGESTTLSFKVKVNNPASEVRYRTIARMTSDNHQKGMIASDGDEISTLMYGIVYDLNGGRSKTGEDSVVSGMFQLDNRDYRIEGTKLYVNLEEDAKAGRMDTPRTQPDWSKVIFAGWSKTKHPGFMKEKPEDMIETLELTGHAKIYAVWAEDENGNGTPDFNETVDYSKLEAAIQKYEDLPRDDYGDLSAAESAVADAQNLMA